MAKLHLKTVAQQMNAEAQKITYRIKDNLLFSYLYDAYCKLHGGSSCGFAEVNELEACDALYLWYQKRYSVELNLPFGTQGTKRFISSKMCLRKMDEKSSKHYYGYNRFRALYQYTMFTGCLVYGRYPPAEFILHTAVAFLLSPQKLDELLRAYGYQRLHVKNIHHLAIYTVLNDREQEEVSQNPFSVYQQLYDEARKLINFEQDPALPEFEEDEKNAFENHSTRRIHEYLIENQNLNIGTMLHFVGNHIDVYNMRHSRLLREHKKLAELFSMLYDQKGIMGQSWSECESQYSLYSFVRSFCKELDHRRFHDNIYGKIRNDGKHPTRELMVILWIYAYCFLFYPAVKTVDDLGRCAPFQQIDKSDTPQYPFERYFDRKQSQLNVLDYLCDEGGPLCGFYDSGAKSSRQFNGSELVAFINKKLQDYSWGVLNGKRPFDFCIEQLNGLQITTDDGRVSIQYRNEELGVDNSIRADNVPIPLVVITELFRHITEEGKKLPLSCALYGQL